jgi:hypothetical protein
MARSNFGSCVRVHTIEATFIHHDQPGSRGNSGTLEDTIAVDTRIGGEEFVVLWNGNNKASENILWATL